jgi:hypothetical protein
MLSASSQTHVVIEQSLDVPEAPGIGERAEYGAEVLVEHPESIWGTPRITLGGISSRSVQLWPLEALPRGSRGEISWFSNNRALKGFSGITTCTLAT